MDVQQFEQAILKMAFETDARLTTASVAYYLGIPSKKANELLEELLDQGVLELDSDDEGNLYYRVPNQGDAPGWQSSKQDSWKRLEAAADAAADQQESPEDRQHSHQIVDSRFGSSVDDDAQQAFDPSQYSPHQGADGDSAQPSPEVASRSDHGGASRSDHGGTGGEWYDTGSQFQQPHDDPYHHSGASRSARQSRFDGVPHGATSRLGRTDARADSCQSESVVVENAASCEPRPLADSKPTVTSCNEVDTSQFSTHQDYNSFGFTAPSQSTALATTSNSGEMTLTRESHHHIEQPEHQPGMALLLSLILCGTGQIYNGEVSKGIIMLILCFLLWFVFLGWVVHIWSIVDAVVVAERINRKSGSSQE